MRVAAVYDIHGNLPALEAVLQDISISHVDLVVVGGDVVPGPMVPETLKLLLDLDIPVKFIRGNGEREVLAQIAGIDSCTVPEQFRDIVRWMAQQLLPGHQQLLDSWPKTLQIDIRGLGEVLFCHATPRSDTEIFTPDLRPKIDSCRSSKESRRLWSSAVIPTCSLTARSEGFES